MTATPRRHRALTWISEPGDKWGWRCRDCPATARGYDTEGEAKRIASIHEDPARAGLRQGRSAAATKN